MALADEPLALSLHVYRCSHRYRTTSAPLTFMILTKNLRWLNAILNFSQKSLQTAPSKFCTPAPSIVLLLFLFSYSDFYVTCLFSPVTSHFYTFSHIYTIFLFVRHEIFIYNSKIVPKIIYYKENWNEIFMSATLHTSQTSKCIFKKMYVIVPRTQYQ